MSFGDVISVKIAQEDDQVTLRYTIEGWKRENLPHHSAWTRLHEWHCPCCGKMDLITTEDVSEDNAGDQHVCLHCGFGFMFTGNEYLDIPETARDDLVAYYKRQPRTAGGNSDCV